MASWLGARPSCRVCFDVTGRPKSRLTSGYRVRGSFPGEDLTPPWSTRVLGSRYRMQLR